MLWPGVVTVTVSLPRPTKCSCQSSTSVVVGTTRVYVTGGVGAPSGPCGQVAAGRESQTPRECEGAAWKMRQIDFCFVPFISSKPSVVKNPAPLANELE